MLKEDGDIGTPGTLLLGVTNYVRGPIKVPVPSKLCYENCTVRLVCYCIRQSHNKITIKLSYKLNISVHVSTLRTVAFIEFW